MLGVRPSTPGLASDVLPELIGIWNLARDLPDDLIAGYRTRWSALQQQGHTYFYEVREKFNQDRDPVDFLFLTRTCVNGLVRFNQAGEFNNSLHHTRPGIHPDRFESVVRAWSAVIQNLEFEACDYRDSLKSVREGDFVFLDPPYVGTRGRYLPTDFDYEQFWLELERITSTGALWMLTLDGAAGDRIYASGIPAETFVREYDFESGESPFPRLMGDGNIRVLERVYLNFDPDSSGSELFHDIGQQLELISHSNMESVRT